MSTGPAQLLTFAVGCNYYCESKAFPGYSTVQHSQFIQAHMNVHIEKLVDIPPFTEGRGQGKERRAGVGST